MTNRQGILLFVVWFVIGIAFGAWACYVIADLKENPGAIKFSDLEPGISIASRLRVDGIPGRKPIPIDPPSAVNIPGRIPGPEEPIVKCIDCEFIKGPGITESGNTFTNNSLYGSYDDLGANLIHQWPMPEKDGVSVWASDPPGTIRVRSQEYLPEQCITGEMALIGKNPTAAFCEKGNWYILGGWIPEKPIRETRKNVKPLNFKWGISGLFIERNPDPLTICFSSNKWYKLYDCTTLEDKTPDLEMSIEPDPVTGLHTLRRIK